MALPGKAVLRCRRVIRLDYRKLKLELHCYALHSIFCGSSIINPLGACPLGTQIPGFKFVS